MKKPTLRQIIDKIREKKEEATMIDDRDTRWLVVINYQWAEELIEGIYKELTEE